MIRVNSLEVPPMSKKKCEKRALPEGSPVYVSEHVISAATGFSLQTLRTWRHQRKGFPYVKLGRAVRYDYYKCLELMNVHEIDLGMGGKDHD